jgi:hypothetical protein
MKLQDKLDLFRAVVVLAAGINTMFNKEKSTDLISGCLYISAAVVGLISLIINTKEILMMRQQELEAFNDEEIGLPVNPNVYQFFKHTPSFLHEHLTTVSNEHNINIDDLTFPDYFFCPITYQVMKEPAYVKGNSSVRFEKSELLNLIRIKKPHPYTGVLLKESDLISDLRLQLEINSHEEQMIRDIKNGTINKENIDKEKEERQLSLKKA